MRTLFLTSLAFLAPTAIAAGPAKQSVCHQDETGVFNLISISVNAADAHLANHADVLPGAYHPDVDGDGFGDPYGVVLPCPTPGYTLDAGDCDDGNAATNPGAAEVCDDEVDNNCELQIDEECGVACPCAGAPLWDEALENGAPAPGYCVDQSFESGSNYDTQTASGFVRAADLRHSGYGDLGFCIAEDHQSGANMMLWISSEEGIACINDISAWLDVNGTVCN